jgi:hypothetical protein
MSQTPAGERVLRVDALVPWQVAYRPLPGMRRLLDAGELSLRRDVPSSGS